MDQWSVKNYRPFKKSALALALKKIMPPKALLGTKLEDVLAAESAALAEAQKLADKMTAEMRPITHYLSQNAPRQLYRDRTTLVKPQVHAGQLKLFLSELRFLTEFSGKDDEKDTAVIYAGAAPGIHLPYLANLFPRIEFVLYDPKKFCDEIFTISNIIVSHHSGNCGIRFDQEIVKSYSGLKKEQFINYMLRDKYEFLFISDIRSGNSDDPKCDFEKCCQDDMDAQMQWIKTMRPAASLIKFRLPYAVGETKYLAPIDNEHLWFGVFAPRNSTELRLIVGPECQMQWYTHAKIEEQAYYFNNFTRVAQYGSRAPNQKKAALGMDNCWDCCAMRDICYKYLSQKYGDGQAPMPEIAARHIILTTNLIDAIVEIIVNYFLMVSENELYDFMAAVIRECNAGEKLHTAPHGDNRKCTPWSQIVGDAGFILESCDPKEPVDRVTQEIRKMYEAVARKK